MFEGYSNTKIYERGYAVGCFALVDKFYDQGCVGVEEYFKEPFWVARVGLANQAVTHITDQADPRAQADAVVMGIHAAGLVRCSRQEACADASAGKAHPV